MSAPRGRGLIALALMLGVAAGGAARGAGPCPETWEASAGPLPGGDQPADFGAIPEACAGTDVALRVRGALLVARSMPDYYGSLISGAMVRGRRRVGARGWLSLAVDALNYRYVNNAGLVSSGASFGPPTVGYYRAVVARERTVAALYGRVLLPPDTARESGAEIGPELGGTARRRLGARTAIEGGVAFTAPVDVVAGQIHSRFETAALAEAWYAPRAAVALFGGASIRAELAPDPVFITAAPRVGGRLALRRRFWAAALVEAPLVGRDRTDLIASLFVGVAP